MATNIQFLRGLASGLTSVTLSDGEPAFTTDTQKLYVGDAGAKVLINPLTETQASSIQTTINNLGTASTKDTGTASGDIPILGTGGKLDPNVIPSIAITDTYVVATQTEMLALSAQQGDVCVVTDETKSYILQQAPASTLTNWVWLESPSGSSAVVSVNNKTGAVTLYQSDLTLNGYTAPTGTTWGTLSATDTGLTAFTTVMNDLLYLNTNKAPLSSPNLTGTPTAPTAPEGSITNQIANVTYVNNAITTALTNNTGNFVKTVNTITPVSGNVTLTGANINLTGLTAVTSYATPTAAMNINTAIANLTYGVENVDGGTF